MSRIYLVLSQVLYLPCHPYVILSIPRQVIDVNRSKKAEKTTHQMEKLIQRAASLVGEFQLSQEWTVAGAVGAALRTDKGNIYTGICVELLCGIGFCAEHAAVASMLEKRETRIESIVAVASRGIIPPCGRCREMLIQVDSANAQTKVIVTEDEWVKLAELLPRHWI